MGLFKNTYDRFLQNVKADLNINRTVKGTTTKSVYEVITSSQIERVKVAIKNWREALSWAEDAVNPDRFDLYLLYKDVVDDYQVTSSMATRTNRVAHSKYYLVDEKGEKDDEQTKLFTNYRTYQFIKTAMNSIYYGYSLIQIEADKEKILNITNVPFINLAPEFSAIKKNAEGGVSTGNLISTDEEPYAEWLIPVYSELTNLGLLNKAVPYYVWKSAFGAWSQHTDLFGMPLRS
jgi:hypothetical protein